MSYPTGDPTFDSGSASYVPPQPYNYNDPAQAQGSYAAPNAYPGGAAPGASAPQQPYGAFSPYGASGYGGTAPVAHPVALGGAYGTPGNFQPYAGNTTDVPLGTPVGVVREALPTTADQPVFEAGYKDVWAAVLFWMHVLVVVILAFALGVPAMKADAARGDNDPSRADLNFNSSLFVRMIILALFVGAVVSALFFFVLKKYGGALIKCALYTSVAVQFLVAVITFAFAPAAAVFLLIMAACMVCYVYYVRNRIPFAAANLGTAVDAIRAYPSLFFVAAGMLLVQGLWIFFWAAAALGIQHSLNTDASNSSKQQKGSQSGGVMMFFLLISFYWGVQVFRGVVHFVTASVVGNWWFLGTPHVAVRGSLHRAFTTNFGSIALGSLVTSVLRAIEVMARSAERRAQQQNRAGAAFLAACAVCLLSCVRRAVEYFNQWALVYVALTGAKYTRAGQEVFQLFTKRGWTAIVNDDLTGAAMGIVCVMVGAISALIGGGTAYVFMGSSHGSVAGVVAFFCFLTGIAMSAVMTGVVTSAVRTVFVCFALNPAALAATHPTNLNQLSGAWNAAFPTEFTQCGYAAAYSGTGPL